MSQRALFLFLFVTELQCSLTRSPLLDHELPESLLAVYLAVLAVEVLGAGVNSLHLLEKGSLDEPSVIILFGRVIALFLEQFGERNRVAGRLLQATREANLRCSSAT